MIFGGETGEFRGSGKCSKGFRVHAGWNWNLTLKWFSGAPVSLVEVNSSGSRYGRSRPARISWLSTSRKGHGPGHGPGHVSSLENLVFFVGNSSLMSALGVGDARTLRPQ